jgi:hypothetical protein
MKYSVRGLTAPRAGGSIQLKWFAATTRPPVIVTPRFHEPRDRLDDLVDAELGRVEDDRVLRRLRVHRVALVTPPEVVGESLRADAGTVGGAAARALALVRNEEHLHLCGRCDHAADVPPLDHRVARSAEQALAFTHDLAHFGMSSDHRH